MTVEGDAESLFPCALVVGRDAADRAAQRLAATGIVALVVPPGRRYHDIRPDSWELRVPASQAARARAILAVDEA